MAEVFGPNSHKYKEEQRLKALEEKKVSKVATGKVTVKKKSEIAKFADKFIADEAANIKKYAIHDVIIPTIKDTIWSIFTNSLDMILFGEDAGRKRSRSSGGNGYISYSSYSDRDRNRSRGYAEPRSRYSYDDIVFETRGDAEYVLDQMDEIIENYKIVSVADMFELAGVEGPYTGNRYGWQNIRNAEVVRAHGGGYMIKMPKAMAID